MRLTWCFTSLFLFGFSACKLVDNSIQGTVASPSVSEPPPAPQAPLLKSLLTSGDIADWYSTAVAPRRIDLGVDFERLFLGEDASCGLTSAGEAYCWGLDVAYTLGNGGGNALGEYPIALPVVGGHTFTNLGMGMRHVCGVTTGGEIYCWGEGGSGRLGHGGGTADIPVPTLVAGGHTFVDVSIAREHSCGLTTGNDIYCWGYGGRGAMGNGTTTTNNFSPVLVGGGHVFTRFADSQSSGLGYHTCAEDNLNQVFCWGQNSSGEIGDGTTTNALTPTPVGGGHTFDRFGAGLGQTCGLKANGDLYCWGDNPGDGTWVDKGTPTLVSGGLKFVDFSVGMDHACAISVAGRLYCWGVDWYGSTGTGLSNNFPLTINIDASIVFTKVYAGGDHSFVIDDQGNLYGWGENYSGPLGTGYGTYSSISVQQQTPTDVEEMAICSKGVAYIDKDKRLYVLEDELDFAEKFPGDATLQIKGGGNGSSGTFCALKEDETIWCWGEGSQGQLGNGANLDSPAAPVQVTSALTFEQIEVGENFGCAIDTLGDTYCWGRGLNGQLGDGLLTSSNTIVAVSGGHNFSQISAGGSHTCGVTIDGDAYCWGSGGSGKLGNGLTATQDQPFLVSGGRKYKEIRTGGSHTCAISLSDDLYCWGENGVGQLGLGDQVDRLTPEPVAITGDVVEFATGRDHTCIVNSNKKAYCWGSNWSYELGIPSLLSYEFSTPQLVESSAQFIKVMATSSYNATTFLIEQ